MNFYLKGLAILCAFPTLLAAQQLSDRFVGGIEPKNPQDVEVFASPPGGFFNLPGAATDTAIGEDTLAVTDVRRVGTFGGADQWYQVSPIDDNGEIGAPLGWIPYVPENYDEITPSELFSRTVTGE